MTKKLETIIYEAINKHFYDGNDAGGIEIKLHGNCFHIRYTHQEGEAYFHTIQANEKSVVEFLEDLTELTDNKFSQPQKGRAMNEQQPELEITVNDRYRNFEADFVTAYKEKKIINDLLFSKCLFDPENVNEAGTIFLDFPTMLIICSKRHNNKWHVEQLNYIFH